jgi:hypothetical protein
MAARLNPIPRAKGDPGDPFPASVPASENVSVAGSPRAAAAGTAALVVPPRQPGNGKSLSWQETEARIIERAWVHPCFVDHIDDLIPDKSTRYHKMRQMADKKKLRFVGYYRETGGRPRDVYCNGWYPNKIEHEVKLTTPLLALLRGHPLHIERGPNVDQRYRADADVFFPGGDVWRVEMLTGSQGLAQLRERFKVYEGCTDFVLVLACRKSLDATPKRKAKGEVGLPDLGKPYAGSMHFALYDEFVKDPWGDVLVDVKGDRYSLKLSLEAGN